jgi:glycosyltransferase involved in cell wall biosynthesis
VSPPAVSVLIPTRNNARHLGAAIASALRQRGVELEVIVGDDASDYATRTLVESVGDARVHYVCHRTRVGVARNRDACLAQARGRYVAWLDGDDEYLPGALARQVSVLDRNPSVALAHAAFELVDETDRRLPDWPAPFTEDTVEPGVVAFRHLLASNEITTSTVVARRALHERVGPFARAARASSSDWAIWLRLALHGDVAYTAAPVARYRQHGDSISRATTSSGERLRCDIAVVRDVLRGERGRIRDPRAAEALARAALTAKALELAGELFTRGERRASMRAVAVAARLAPAPERRWVAHLLLATARSDAAGCYRANKEIVARLATRLAGTRYGARLAAAARIDPAWQETLERAAATLRRVLPADAIVASVTKWDPTLLALAGRSGRNFPDRGALPDGYPRDGATAVAHLSELRREAGLSHLVFTSASFWWLEHYPELAAHLDAQHALRWRDGDLAVYELGADA